MLKAIILEDETDSRNLLLSYLKDYCPQVQVLAAVDCVSDAVAAVREASPDLVFLDIELRGETSFDLLTQLDPISFEIIFTTAYEHYMLRAIKLSAVDYLLKPINSEELKEAVVKVEKRRQQSVFNKSLETLMHNLRGGNSDQKIAVSAPDGYIFIRVADIIYLQSEGAYTYFFMKENKKLVASRNIREYEDLLSDHNFFRIHKSYIVNVAEIQKYIRGEGGTVVMSNNCQLDVSRRRKEEFLELLHRA